MAAEIQMGGVAADRIFLGTDGTRQFVVLDLDTDPDGGVIKDISGKTIQIDIRRKDAASDVLLSATCPVSGTYDADPDTNTQRAVWTFADTDLTTDVFGLKGGTFRYSVKDLTDGAETILQYGDIVIDRATQV